MKKTRCLTVVILSFLMLIVFPYASARADVIWTPSDRFFEKNYEKCVQVGRSYYANGKEGYVQVLKSPVSNGIIRCIANGNIFYVSYSYKDGKGETWGVVQYTVDAKGTTTPAWSGKNAVTGWVRMDSLTLVYDNISFMEEYAKDIKEYSGGFNPDECKEKLVFYTYPGSGEVSDTITMEYYKNFSSPIEISLMFTDEQGKEWGYVQRYYNIRTAWICFSSPEDESLPQTRVEKPELVPPATDRQLKQAEISSGVWLAAALVAVVVIVTAVLVRLFWKKK